MSLDLAVSQLVLRARQIERALHDSAPWTMGYAGMVAPATRTVTEDGVLFTAVFPSVCHLQRPSGILWLRCGSELVGSKLIEDPGDGEFEAEWAFSLKNEAIAA